MSKIKGYKVFNSDWTCRGFQYEVGKTFEHNGEIEMCDKGFHFCRKAVDCFNYYRFDPNNKVAEVEAIGDTTTQGDKSVTNKITIMKEIKWSEVLEIVNTGNYNTGYRNTGDYNTGYRNTGDCNTGGYNTGDYNTGFFSTKTPKIDLFEKPTNLSMREILNLKGIQILNCNFATSWWVHESDMSELEKKEHPEYKITGGYLKTVDYKTGFKMMWDNLSDDEKTEIKLLPNFDNVIFEDITGIKAEV